jgi:hypothetical protein
MSNPSRVVDADGRIKGIVWFGNYFGVPDPNERTVDDVMEKLEPDAIVSSSTTILEAVELFVSRPNYCFYVVHVNEIVGIVFYSDLFKPLGRLAFLALALEIEDQALALCRTPAIADRAWHALSENRRRMAIEVFRRRYGRDPDLSRNLRALVQPEQSDVSLLIACTNLIDKATMIWKMRLVEAANRDDVLGFFTDLKKIRDRCAHPGSDEELIPTQAIGDNDE